MAKSKEPKPPTSKKPAGGELHQTTIPDNLLKSGEKLARPAV
jgi:hypothetical protein